MVHRVGSVRTRPQSLAGLWVYRTFTCRRAGFRRITFGGDTPFTPTTHRDRWDRDGVRFRFGSDARDHLEDWAERLPDLRHGARRRPPRSADQDGAPPGPGAAPGAGAERQYETLRLIGEEVAEFEDRPVACQTTSRVIVLRTKRVVAKGPPWRFEPDRYVVDITNDRATPAAEIVFLAHDRCDQENLIAPLKSGVKALSMPVDDLVRHGASMQGQRALWAIFEV